MVLTGRRTMLGALTTKMWELEGTLNMVVCLWLLMNCIMYGVYAVIEHPHGSMVWYLLLVKRLMHLFPELDMSLTSADGYSVLWIGTHLKETSEYRDQRGCCQHFLAALLPGAPVRVIIHTTS